MSAGVVVARDGEIGDGEALLVTPEVSGSPEPIAVFYDGGAYFALNDTCTHAQASLSEGWIEDGKVECPLHNTKFCLRTGEVLSMPATVDAITHRIEVRDDEIVLYPGEAAG
jgi:3-phenylpropionate/trans-cinnamate dioxygenase ferredoxin subunit